MSRRDNGRFALRSFAVGCALLAVPILVRPQGSRTINVKTFGAKGDGATDDTTVIEAASRLVAQNGGALVFPLGTYVFDPHRAKILVGSNMTVLGPGTIKVKANAGNYRYIIGPPDPRLPIDNVTLDGLHVDQNTNENRLAVISEGDDRTAQYVFLSWRVKRLQVRNCTIDASGVNTIVANGTDVESAEFENNTFVFQQRVGQRSFDNSAIYFRGRKGSAHGNHCRSSPGAAAVTCIEMHDGDFAIRDNVIEGYLIGMNIVDPVHAVVENNRGTALENGAFVWATPGHVAHDVTFTGNRFLINNVDRLAPESAGIAAYYGYKVTGSWDGIVIRHNEIVFQPEMHARTVRYPRSNWGISTQAFGPVRNVVIADNTIENAPVRGIKIGERIDLPLSEPLQSEILVERNTILNAGYNRDQTVAPYRAAIAAEGKLRGVVIRDNVINDSAVAAGVYSVWFPNRIEPYASVWCYGQRVSPLRGLLELIPREIKRRPTQSSSGSPAQPF